MHFATPQDVSVVVPVNEELTEDLEVRRVLQIDDDEIDDSVNRIRNWTCQEDRKILNSLLKNKDISVLFNPRPFGLTQEEEEPGSSVSETEGSDGRGGAAGGAAAKSGALLKKRIASPPCGGGGSAQKLQRASAGVRGPLGWEPGQEDVSKLHGKLHGLGISQEMRLNPYIVDVVYNKLL
jgi:hypothetical protein